MEEEKQQPRQQVAYLRALDASKQCELAFNINCSVEGITVCENVKALRQATDTVGSMLSHIKNKLHRAIKTKSEREPSEDLEIPLSLKGDGEKIKDEVVLKSLIDPSKTYEFEIFNQNFKLVVNAPWVQMITLPGVIYASSMIQPIRCKILHAVRDLCDYEWHRSVDKTKWQKVGTKYIYKTKAGDVNHYLKFRCVPRTRTCCGEPYEVVSEAKVKAVPTTPKCPFEDRHQHTTSKLTDKEFRVVSYNVLSSRYSETNSQFPYCANEFLAIDYRKQLLVKEISGYNADVICLQEVDHKEYRHYFDAKFKKFGYDSIFHKKGNKIPEGLCCLYNAKKFKAAYSTQLVYSAELNGNPIFKHIKDSIKYGPDIEDIFLKQLTSLQVTVLQSKILNQKLIVGNTHLYYHPEAYHIRVIQAAMAAAFLDHLKKTLQEESRKTKVSVIFCGDFNSVPSSSVYQYLTYGKLEGEHGNCSKILRNIGDLCNPFQFGSACGTSDFTNYTRDFKACLDYIFYDTNSIKLLRSVPFLDESVLSKNVALPSEVFPSDHLALVADLRFL